MHFSNSLIIQKEKTKEITTVTVVWIPDLYNKHKILRTFALNFSKNYEWFEKPYQKLEVFHQVSKHLEVGQKNSAAPRFFNPLLEVWMS